MSINTQRYETEKQTNLKIINWLIEQFPAAFFKKTKYIKPLKIGIIEDIFLFYDRLETPPFSKKSLRQAITYYCTSPAYLSTQKIGTERIDLYGNEMEVVTAEQAKYAQLRYERQYLTPKSKVKPTQQVSEQPANN